MVAALPHMSDNRLRQLAKHALDQAATNAVRRALEAISIEVAGGRLRVQLVALQPGHTGSATLQFHRAIDSASASSDASTCTFAWSHVEGFDRDGSGRLCRHSWSVASGVGVGSAQKTIFSWNMSRVNENGYNDLMRVGAPLKNWLVQLGILEATTLPAVEPAAALFFLQTIFTAMHPPEESQPPCIQSSHMLTDEHCITKLAAAWGIDADQAVEAASALMTQDQ